MQFLSVQLPLVALWIYILAALVLGGVFLWIINLIVDSYDDEVRKHHRQLARGFLNEAITGRRKIHDGVRVHKAPVNQTPTALKDLVTKFQSAELIFEVKPRTATVIDIASHPRFKRSSTVSTHHGDVL